jgi:uncharacterized protein
MALSSPSTQEVRLLIVPGLHGSSSDHWQTRLEREHPSAVRVSLADWSRPDLDTWADAIGRSLAQAVGPAAEAPTSAASPSPLLRWRRQHEVPARPAVIWLAVAHSFGCLALAHYLLRGSLGIEAALMVAPANPERFGIPEGLLDRHLPRESTLVFSRNDPWMTEPDARYLGRHWGSELVDAGLAGHINPASGHGSFPLARQWVAQQQHLLAQRERPALLQPRTAAAPGSRRWQFAV